MDIPTSRLYYLLFIYLDIQIYIWREQMLAMFRCNLLDCAKLLKLTEQAFSSF